MSRDPLNEYGSVYFYIDKKEAFDYAIYELDELIRDLDSKAIVDLLGLKDEEKGEAGGHAFDQILDALDEVTKNYKKANAAVKALKILKKAIDGKKKLDDPATQKQLDILKKMAERFIQDPTFDHCLELCRTMVDYFDCQILNVSHWCVIHCNNVMKKVKN